MPSVLTNIGALADVLTVQAVRATPVDALAGFDVVAQFSHGLLNQQVVRSLAQHGLTHPGAYVTWGSLPLPASVAALVPPRLGLELATTREARLELRLARPYLSALRWPPVDQTGGTGGSSSTMAHALPQARTAEITWRIELNVLTARFDQSAAELPPSTADDSPPSSSMGSHGVFGAQLDTAFSPDVSVSRDPGWDRVTLASTAAVTPATAQTAISARAWRFGIELDFSETVAAVSTDAPALNDFLAEDSGRNLLAQLLAPLKAASGIRLTPQIAPGGPLSEGAVRRAPPPAFTVRDVVLQNDRGEFLLALCAQLGGSRDGVLRLVPSFVGAQDFAYAASTEVLALAYKVAWGMAASGLSFVGEVPVDLPVGNDPHKTLPGRAQLRMTFSTVLDDVTITAMPGGGGDAIRLTSKQRIELLNLWDHANKRITDLGDLANPQEEVLVVPITPFAKGGAQPGALQASYRDLLLKLVAVILFPMTEPFDVWAGSISGFCSAAMKTAVVIWTLKPQLSDVHVPVSGLVGVQL